MIHKYKAYNSKEKSKKVEEINTMWVSILLPLISIVATLSISILISEVKLELALLILIAVIIFLSIFLYITLIIFKSIHERKIKQIVSNVSEDTKIASYNKLNINAVGINGIFPESEIAHMENNNYYENIWLISHDLLTEIEDGVYAGAVIDNIKRGINYTYFVPKNLEIEPRIKLLKEKCNNSKRLKFFYLDDSFFFLVPNIDFSIYEPTKTFSEGKKGFLGVDIDGLPGRYEALMSNNFVDVLVAKLSQIIDKEGGK